MNSVTHTPTHARIFIKLTLEFTQELHSQFNSTLKNLELHQDTYTQ